MIAAVNHRPTDFMPYSHRVFGRHQDLELELEQALAELPVLDAHTHLVGGKLGARGLHDVLL